jgi:pilus assembly protein CpaF
VRADAEAILRARPGADPALVGRVRQALADSGADPTPSHVAAALRSQGRVLGDQAILDVVDTLRREAGGAGPLEPLLADPTITDVLVNGHDQVFVDRGDGLSTVPSPFPDEQSVRRLAQRLAAGGGRRLDDASPWVDLRLADGTRFHAVLAPVARPGTVISLRVPARRGLPLNELRARRTLSEHGEALLRDLVAARVAFLVTGGTGSGKTTLLAALLEVVDAADRVVVVEDASELRPEHPHVVGLEGRPPNVEGAGGIVLRDLVRQALRMRPDRVVVGEVRGAEVVDLLAALNTGHEGGCGTLHANSPADVPARLEALGVAAGMSREAVHSQVAAALQVVVHVVRDRGGTRRLREIAVLESDAGSVSPHVRSHSAVVFEPDGRAVRGPAAQRLDELLARPAR